jgi:hypothetical protein
MKTLYSIIIIIVLFAGITISAQSKIQNDNPYNLSEAAIDNFKEGLKSDNEGLRRSCIYFLGQYKIGDAAFALMNLMDKESVPRNRILIAFSLYNIGDKWGMKKVKEHSILDNEKEVKRMCTAIYDEYKNSPSIDYVELTGLAK